MIPAQLALRRAERRLVQWLAELEDVADAHREEYAALAAALAQIVPALAPENGGALLTTAEMASRLNVSPKTLLRRRAQGKAEAVQLAERGRGALRWRP